jgi:hypothetical protein
LAAREILYQASVMVRLLLLTRMSKSLTRYPKV